MIMNFMTMKAEGEGFAVLRHALRTFGMGFTNTQEMAES